MKNSEIETNITQAAPLAGYLALKREIDSAVRGVMSRGRYILGEEVSLFEQEFAAWLGRGHVVGVGSGTDAIEVSLRALGVGRGDVVFTVSLTSVATVAAIVRCGASPVLVDVTEQGLVMDPSDLERQIKRVDSGKLKAAAIVPVHLHGMPADMLKIMKIARRWGLKVVEDCAQAHGARICISGTWRNVGTIGDAGCFSFYPTKNLSAIGDAGAAVFRNKTVSEKAERIRQYGWDKKRISTMPGINSRLDELQAAILRVKLKHLDSLNEERRAIARIYHDSLSGDKRLVCPIPIPGRRSVFHQYVVRVKNRSRVIARLAQEGVGTSIHYPVPVHQQPGFADVVDIGRQVLPVTELLSEEILSLPMYPELRAAQVKRIAASLLRALR